MKEITLKSITETDNEIVKEFEDAYHYWTESYEALSAHIQRIRMEYFTKVRVCGERIGALREQHKELIRKNPRSSGKANAEADRLLNAISDAEKEINVILNEPSMMTFEEETAAAEQFITAVQAYNEAAFTAKQLEAAGYTDITAFDRSNIDCIVSIYKKFVQMGCEQYALMEYPNDRLLNGVELAYLEAVSP